MPTGIRAAFAADPEFFPAVFSQEVVSRLRSQVELEPGAPLTRFDTPQARRVLAGTQILITGWGCPRIDGDVLEQAPALQAVVHAAGTVKQHVDPAVFARGVAVSSAASANAKPVAEYTIAAAVLAAKRAFGGTRSRDGLDGATFGVVGASRIGRLVIGRLHEYGVRVLLADPFVSDADAAGLGAELVDLDALCQASDLVSIHAPELPETRHLFDERRLALLRDGAVLINTARGSLIDTPALTKQCIAGRLDAVLDVTDPEPLPDDHPLRELPNVLITPHIAGAQGREQRRLGEYAADEVERFISGLPLDGPVFLDDLVRIA